MSLHRKVFNDAQTRVSWYCSIWLTCINIWGVMYLCFLTHTSPSLLTFHLSAALYRCWEELVRSVITEARRASASWAPRSSELHLVGAVGPKIANICFRGIERALHVLCVLKRNTFKHQICTVVDLEVDLTYVATPQNGCQRASRRNTWPSSYL